MLKNAYLGAKIGFDTAANELSKVPESGCAAAAQRALRSEQRSAGRRHRAARAPRRRTRCSAPRTPPPPPLIVARIQQMRIVCCVDVLKFNRKCKVITNADAHLLRNEYERSSEEVRVDHLKGGDWRPEPKRYVSEIMR